MLLRLSSASQPRVIFYDKSYFSRKYSITIDCDNEKVYILGTESISALNGLKGKAARKMSPITCIMNFKLLEVSIIQSSGNVISNEEFSDSSHFIT